MAGALRGIRKRHVWLMVPFVALVAPLSRPFGDNSFLWHVRAGTVQLDAGEVLRSDPFSWTAAGESWRTQSWLAELGYGLLERTFGGIGWATLVVAVVLVAAGLLVMRRASRLDAPLPAVVLVGLVFVLQTFVFAVPRPVVFSYVLLAAVALVVDRDDKAELWLAPALVWLWASLHGSFVLGLAVIGLDALRRREARRWLTLGAATVAASVTAHGVAVWQILFDFLRSRETLSFIEEWQRPDPFDIRVAPFFVALVLLVVLVVGRRLEMRNIIMAIPFALFGLLAVRNTLPALIVIGPIVAAGALGGAPKPAKQADDGSPLVNGVMVAAVAALIVLVAAQPRELLAERFPGDELVAELEPGGRVFHDDAVGGYLIWKMGPELSVYIDDRAELYGSEPYREMSGLLDGERDVARLDELEATQALVPRDAPLVGRLREAGWEISAEDGVFVLLHRTS